MKYIIKYLDYALYWLIVLIPFSMAIAPGRLSLNREQYLLFAAGVDILVFGGFFIRNKKVC